MNPEEWEDERAEDMLEYRPVRTRATIVPGPGFWDCRAPEAEDCPGWWSTSPVPCQSFVMGKCLHHDGKTEWEARKP